MKSLIRRSAAALLSPWIRRDAPQAGAAWLTFDDGPHPQQTPRILAALAESGVSATFFMVGDEMRRYPALVAAVREAGHEIALHGQSHRHAPDLGWRGQWRDLQAMRRTALALGVPVRRYRPAYGELTMVRALWCLLHGVRIVMWNYESRDSFVTSAEELLLAVQSRPLRAGDVALFHDDTPATAEALPRLIAHFHASGLALRVPE